MRERTDAGWGPIAFTIAAGAAMLLVLVTSPLAHAPFRAPEKVAAGSAVGESAPPTPLASPGPRGPVPDAAAVKATFIASSAPAVIHPGQVTQVVLLFRNEGTTEWVSGTRSEARLGIFGDDMTLYRLGMAERWLLPTRPAVQSESTVLPGGTAQFSFLVKGTELGRYQIKVGPVIDGVAWTGAWAVLDVTVQ